MKRKNITKSGLEDLPKSKTNWDKVKNMSDEEVYTRALKDSDALPLTDKELTNFKKVFPPEEINIKDIRKNLHFSQSKFANFFGISKRTLQEWEQGRSKPRGSARVLLAVIANDPMAIHKALIHFH